MAVIIPTLDRPIELLKTLEQLDKQTVKPQIVVIVDSSSQIADTNAFSQKWNHHHMKTNIRSSSIQRNIGLEVLKNFEYDFILFHDDDMNIWPDYIYRLIETFAAKSNAIGVSGIALPSMNDKSGKQRMKKTRDLLGKPGSVSKSGINLPVTKSDGLIISCDWLIGCSMWRKLDSKFKFEETLSGYAIFEDVIFSMNIKLLSSMDLFVNTSISIEHRIHTQRLDGFIIKRNWIINRFRAAKLFPQKIDIRRMWLTNFAFLLWTLLRLPFDTKVYFSEFKGIAAGIYSIWRLSE